MKRKGFTLIELVIAILILAVVAVSVYGSFSAGVKAWRRGGEDRELQKIRIALLKIQKELRSSFFFSKAPFKGASSEITFPLAASGKDKDEIYVIDYYVTEDRHAGLKVLMKRKALFAENRFSEERPMEEFIFSADSIDFEYAYGLKDGSRGIEWKDAWPESQEKLPLAVKINFKLGADEDIYHKTIFISQGELGAE